MSIETGTIKKKRARPVVDKGEAVVLHAMPVLLHLFDQQQSPTGKGNRVDGYFLLIDISYGEKTTALA